MTKMKYNLTNHKQMIKCVDSQGEWRERYLNGLSAEAWCEHGLRLQEGLPPWAAEELPTQVGAGRGTGKGSSTSLSPLPPKKLKRGIIPICACGKVLLNGGLSCKKSPTKKTKRTHA